MSQRQWLVLGISTFLIALIFPPVPIFFWAVLFLSAWYIKRIPEKRLPLASFFTTHQPTFYNWLSGFLADWSRVPMYLFFFLSILTLFIWGALTLKLIPLPIYGASIGIKDSRDGNVGAYTTTGSEPYCFNNLPIGKHTISEVNPPGFVSSTQDIITATIQSGSMTLVEFGNYRSAMPVNLIARPPVTAQPKIDVQKPISGSICVLAWNDVNANGIRETDEPLLPEMSLQLDSTLVLGLVGILFWVCDLLSFSQAWFMAWDAKIWQAEPTGRALLGAEFEELSNEQKKQLYRHIAEVSIGINKGTWVVSEGKYEIKHPPADTFAKFGGPGVLIIQEGHAVVLERGGRISRVVGAGYHQLKPFERVHMVVYLPTRIEKVQIKDALTRDKMHLREFELLVFHRADRGDQSEYSGQYRYDPKVIREKIWNPKGNDWRETVKSVMDSVGRDVIACYNFEDILSISGEARIKFRQELRDRANEITQRALGVEVTGTNVGTITISEEAKRALEAKGLSEVARQTVLVTAEAEKEAMARRGEGQAIAIRRLEQEKSAIRTELMRQLMEPLRLMTGGVLADKDVANNVIAAVERLLGRLQSSMVRDDLDLIRYREMLDKIKDVEGPKTVILGDTRGINTSIDMS